MGRNFCGLSRHHELRKFWVPWQEEYPAGERKQCRPPEKRFYHLIGVSCVYFLSLRCLPYNVQWYCSHFDQFEVDIMIHPWRGLPGRCAYKIFGNRNFPSANCFPSATFTIFNDMFFSRGRHHWVKSFLQVGFRYTWYPEKLFDIIQDYDLGQCIWQVYHQNISKLWFETIWRRMKWWN